MKKATFILSMAAIAGAVVFSSCNNNNTQATETKAEENLGKGAVVYFNMDALMQDYDLANDLGSAVEAKTNSIMEEINRRGNKLQKEVNEFQAKIEKGLLTRSVAEQQGQKLSEKQNEFQNYQAQKQQEMQEEVVVMQNQIADAIKTYVDKFREEKGYAYIFATQGEVITLPIVSADPAYDVTDQILEGLNAEYVQEKAKSDKK